MTTDEDKIDLGIQAMTWLGSELGQSLADRAQGEIDSYVEQLITFKSTDPEITHIQTEIIRRRQLFEWLSHIMDEGAATHELEQTAERDDGD